MTQHPRTAQNASASGCAGLSLWLRPKPAAALAVCLLAAAGALTVRAALADDTIKIAVVGPSEGPQAARTRSIEEGARAAVEMLARASASPIGDDASGKTAPGTYAAYAVTLKDDGCDSAKAEAMAEEIVAQKFDLVLGHPCPKAALAAAKIYGTAGITFIATETRHPDLTAKRAGPSIFRLSGRDDAQGLDAARYLLDGRRFKTIAVVNDRTLYAKTIAEQAEAALRAHKQDIVTATIIAGDKDYTKLIAKIKDAGAVFFAGFPMEAGFILKQLRAAGSAAVFLASETVGTREFADSFGEVAREAFVLAPMDEDTATAAADAVRVFHRSQAAAMGPHRDTAMERAAINARIASSPIAATSVPRVEAGHDMKAPREIRFDAAGNANVDSFRLVRWNGEGWTAAGASLLP